MRRIQGELGQRIAGGKRQDSEKDKANQQERRNRNQDSPQNVLTHGLLLPIAVSHLGN